MKGYITDLGKICWPQEQSSCDEETGLMFQQA